MSWIISIILLGIVIGVARTYPKTSILIAVLLLVIYVNRDSASTPDRKTNKTELIQNSSSSNRVQNNPSNYYSPKNLKRKSDYNYRPSISTSNNKIKTNSVKTRIGAVCNDGTTSRATGRGACSHHGGVSYWLYE
ncbi:DUF3761 domain-containing protein [Arenibacter aquaticus]|uniref:DUF3761 domain-containing protein n=1 Tax=Arenibacter aquaticus TaxID=2489054 RepID=A0A3S0AES9_9FLAO|nr:DUF3761 domain-containing protein [Arenibacter aquaticus]RTE53955.1 DUF3761 domain-containing protein [Arenibacter aquaticus]